MNEKPHPESQGVLDAADDLGFDARTPGNVNDQASHDEVTFLAIGLVVASACAPNTMSAEDVERAANRLRPTGIEAGWSVSNVKAFKTGEPNPCPCNDHPNERRHWLLEC